MTKQSQLSDEIILSCPTSSFDMHSIYSNGELLSTINDQQEVYDTNISTSQSPSNDNEREYKFDTNCFLQQNLKLPKHSFYFGLYSNSYFTPRLRLVVFLLVLLDTIGIILFWSGDRDTLFTFDNFLMSLQFQNVAGSCDTIISYATLVYHLLPFVFIMWLPMSGIRLFEPFQRDLSSINGRKKLTRTLFFQVCELSGAMLLVMNIFVSIYFIWSFSQGENFYCSEVYFQAYGWAAILSFVLLHVEVVCFTHFREHLKMQLGAFQESDQTGAIRSRLAHKRFFFRSTKKNIECEIRKNLFKVTEQGDLKELERMLKYATNKLGPNFASTLYASPKIYLSLFGYSKKNPMHAAANRGNVGAMELLLAAGFSVNALDKVARIQFSSGNIFWYFARFIVQRIDIPSADNGRSLFKTTLVSPLHCAVATGHVNAVAWLIAKGASVNCLSPSTHRIERLPPLFLTESPEIASMLIEAGANPLAIPDPGHFHTMTYYQIACVQGNIPLVNELEKWGGDVALTPLHEAASLNQSTVVWHLLQNQADPNCLGELGYVGLHRRTPLHWSAINGAVDTSDLLLDAGADPNFQDADGRTPLHWAARRNHPNVVSLLLRRGSKPDAKDKNGFTPLLYAAQIKNANKKVFELLLYYGANIKEQLRNGDTALHIAMKSQTSSIETALTLLNMGADIMKINHDGFRPLDCTTSTVFQFELKKAAGNRDVMISYTHSHSDFAIKLRKGLEDAKITTWMDLMDPSGIGGGSVWREEIARGIKNAAVVLCVLTEDYEKSEWCLKELALAKANGKPILAVRLENTVITTDLQWYLYTRQIIPFESAVRNINSTNPKSIVYSYNEEKFTQQLQVLVDGIKDEIENQKLNRSNLLVHSRSIIKQSIIGESCEIINGSEDFSSGDYIFLAHGGHHASFAYQVYTKFQDNGVNCFVDSFISGNTVDMQQRIHLCKEAILNCCCFVIVMSSKNIKCELMRDLLAFAEDRHCEIIPIVLNDIEFALDKQYTFSRTKLCHFIPDLGFVDSFVQLLERVQKIKFSNLSVHKE